MRHYCKSVCLVFGNDKDIRPPNASRVATRNIGTRQYTSTSSPNARFPRIAAILPTLIKTPEAVDLSLVGYNSTPRTSNEFHPITDIALNIHDITRLCVEFLNKAMKNTLTPEITILTASRSLRPTLSIMKIVKRFPGRFETAVRKLSKYILLEML